MKVFISYGDPTDQVIALRLQALAAVNGLTVYVPPVMTRGLSSVLPEVGAQLSTSDVVLAVVANGVSPGLLADISLSQTGQKQLLVMADQRFSGMLALVGDAVIDIDPRQPGEAERTIVAHLNAMKNQKSAGSALLALATLALGMLLFASAKQTD